MITGPRVVYEAENAVATVVNRTHVGFMPSQFAQVFAV